MKSLSLEVSLNPKTFTIRPCMEYYLLIVSLFSADVEIVTASEKPK